MPAIAFIEPITFRGARLIRFSELRRRRGTVPNRGTFQDPFLRLPAGILPMRRCSPERPKAAQAQLVCYRLLRAPFQRVLTAGRLVIGVIWTYLYRRSLIMSNRTASEVKAKPR